MSIKEKLSKFFFYTLVNNYSIYAYNSFDYKEENTSLAYEAKIRKKKYATDDERSWLNGIFHKNDGYQVPLVLSPYRDKGNININLENELSKERLMALMIMPKQNFRVINNHLEVRGISISRKKYVYDAQRVRNKGYYKNKDEIEITSSLFNNMAEDTKKQIIKYLAEYLKDIYNTGKDIDLYEGKLKARLLRLHNPEEYLKEYN